MYNICLNKRDNIVSIKIQGCFDSEQADKMYADAASIIRNAKTALIVLTDISEVDEMKHESIESLSKIMELFNSHGTKQVIRIIPDSSKDIGLNILSRFHYSPDVKIHTFDSQEKAGEYMRSRTGALNCRQ
jgi:anti-anti-sigma regulatory factor